jgi:hypothetical protein
MEVHVERDQKSYGTFLDGATRVLVTNSGPKEAWMAIGIIGALLYAAMQGMLDVGLKVGYEKVSLQVHQILLP